MKTHIIFLGIAITTNFSLFKISSRPILKREVFDEIKHLPSSFTNSFAASVQHFNHCAIDRIFLSFWTMNKCITHGISMKISSDYNMTPMIVKKR